MAGQQDIKKCAKCGSCTPVCPVYQCTGRESHTARGKLHLFKKGSSFSSAYFNDLLSKCIQCGACDHACPRNLRPSADIRSWRGHQPFGRDPHRYLKHLSRKMLASPFLQKAGSKTLHALFDKLPEASGLRKRIGLVVPDLITKPSHSLPPRKNASTPLVYFPGCLAKHLYNDIHEATAILASHCGYDLHSPGSLTCCGLASHASGNMEEARALAKKNIQAFKNTEGPILTSCASCSSHLSSYPDLFSGDEEMFKEAENFANRIQEFSTFFINHKGLKGTEPKETVFYHDPCHLRFGPCRANEEPRQLIEEMNGSPPLSLPSHCCGQGGLFHLTNPDLSKEIFNKAAQPLVELTHGTVVTTCSGCLLQWQQGLAQGQSSLRAEHLAVFLAKLCKD